jgi:hypothetical protein
MFTWIRALLVERSVRSKIDRLRTLVLESFGPVEPFVWRDPYVVAYVTEVVDGLVKQSTGAELESRVRVLTCGRCCERLTGIPAKDLLPFSTDLRLRGRREFRRGSDDGLLCLAFLDGGPKLGMRSQFVQRLVDEARLCAENFEAGIGETTDPIALVAPYLLTRDLIGRMREVRDAAVTGAVTSRASPSMP